MDCVQFIPDWQKVAETCLALTISFSFVAFGYSRISLSTPTNTYGITRYYKVVAQSVSV